MQQDIQRADNALRAVFFQLKRFYGLGADARNDSAIRKIYQLKNRPVNHPLIVYLADESEILDWTVLLSDEAKHWIQLLSD